MGIPEPQQHLRVASRVQDGWATIRLCRGQQPLHHRDALALLFILTSDSVVEAE